MTRWTHKSALAHYGAIPRNPRWSWSGRSRDGQVVAVILWKDLFEDGGRTYRSGSHSTIGNWFGSLGHVELIENLHWALENCDGEVRVVVAVARDTKATPRSIKECYPTPALRMKVVALDGQSMDFALARIEPASALDKPLPPA